jgi:putative addiction module killer protein
MIEVRQTELFAKWHKGLTDHKAQKAIAKRIRRLEGGLLGDVEPVGEGVSEARIHINAGYRLYFVRRGKTVLILLCGGDKSTQTADIKKAKEMASTV